MTDKCIDSVPKRRDIIDGVDYRCVQRDDMEEIKLLHETFFPVRYSDQFYVDTCNGKGMHGGKLFSTVAVHQCRIVGFALAQLLPYPDKTEDKELFPDLKHTPKYACYILTLGIVDEFRRLGLGTILIRHCEDHAKTFEDCGAVTAELAQPTCRLYHVLLGMLFHGLDLILLSTAVPGVSARHHLQHQCYPILRAQRIHQTAHDR